MPLFEVVSCNFHFATRDLDDAERVMHKQIGRSFQDPRRPDVTLITDGEADKTFTHTIPADAPLAVYESAIDGEASDLLQTLDELFPTMPVEVTGRAVTPDKNHIDCVSRNDETDSLFAEAISIPQSPQST